jgi:two-component system, NarL family, response regulator NreC
LERPDDRVKVVLIDSQTLFREGLAVLVDQQQDLVVVGHAATINDGGWADEPDVVISDAALGEMRGHDIVCAIKNVYSKASVLVVTAIDRPVMIREMLAAGAHGYLLKSDSAADLFVGIRAVARGEMYMQPSLGVTVAREQEAKVGPDGHVEGRLTAKEEEVLSLVAVGHTNAEVARVMSVSLRTIETHRARIQVKLGHPTRAQLVRHAHDAGLLYF